MFDFKFGIFDYLLNNYCEISELLYILFLVSFYVVVNESWF